MFRLTHSLKRKPSDPTVDGRGAQSNKANKDTKDGGVHGKITPGDTNSSVTTLFDQNAMKALFPPSSKWNNPELIGLANVAKAASDVFSNGSVTLTTASDHTVFY